MDDHSTRVNLKENPLTTDYMEICHEGYHYIAPKHPRVKVVFYTYAHEWGDNENIFYATTVENALKRYQTKKGKLTEDEMDDIETIIACDDKISQKALKTKGEK